MNYNRYSSEAIELAMQGRWEEAKAMNESIIELYPNDVGAHNRLGKALIKLGEHDEAARVYEQVLKLDPGNGIAKKNLERLHYIKDKDGKNTQSKPSGSISSFFLEETGKSRLVYLSNVAPDEILAKLSAGDELFLVTKGHKLTVTDSNGEYIGDLESRLGSHLVELMKGGNEYQAAVAGIGNGQVRVLIRETFRHPSLADYSSFPPKTLEQPRPVKDTMFKYDYESEIESVDEFGEWEDEVKPHAEEAPTEPEENSLTDETGTVS
ncbi:MAG: tetratricopeptide repeat protein [Chloroflexota bacterium]